MIGTYHSTLEPNTRKRYEYKIELRTRIKNGQTIIDRVVSRRDRAEFPWDLFNDCWNGREETSYISARRATTAADAECGIFERELHGRSGGKIANQEKNRACKFSSASSSPLRIRNRTRKERVSCVPSADIRVLESDTDTGRTCRDENSFAPRSPASSPRASSFSRRRRFQGKIAIFQPLSTRRPIPPRYILINVATKVWNAYRKCWNERFKKKRRKKIGSSRKYAEYSAMSGARISRAIGI